MWNIRIKRVLAYIAFLLALCPLPAMMIPSVVSFLISAGITEGGNHFAYLFVWVIFWVSVEILLFRSIKKSIRAEQIRPN